MKNMDFEIYENLKKGLADEEYEVVLEHSFRNKEGLKFDIDIVIKKGNEIVAIFEVKNKIIKSYWDKGIYAKQCQLYHMSFPLSNPLIYLTDGKDFYEYCETQFKESITFDEVVKAIKERSPREKDPDYKSFIDFLNENSKLIGKSFIKDIQEKVKENARNVFDVLNNTFCFNSEYEEMFFRSILDSYPEDDPESIYRYTSLKRVFETISDEGHTMASIVRMNDKTECFYANEYIKSKRNKDYKNNAEDITDSYKRNWRCFIMSCTDNPNENLKMWEDYGDNYKGVRICYNYQNDKNFFVAKVSYAKDYEKHPALDFIATIQKEYGGCQFEIKNWNIWQHFFKPFDYREEKEIRVLYFLTDEKLNEIELKWFYNNNEIYPIISFQNKSKETSIFPFQIKKIQFGRNVSNMDYNKVMLEQMIEQKSGGNNAEIDVDKSSLSISLS